MWKHIITNLSFKPKVLSNKPFTLKIDHREKSSGIGKEIENAALPFKYEFTHLNTGDYLLEDKIIIERKTLPDFLTSLKSGRLFNQAYRMAKCNACSVIIIEGEKAMADKSLIKRNAVQGSLIHLTIFLGIPILRAKNIKETLELFLSIGNQLHKYQYPRSKATIFKNPQFKIGHSQREKILFLQNLPGIGVHKALSLLESFGSIDKILTAKTSELAEVKGIGVKLANDIYSLIHNKFYK